MFENFIQRFKPAYQAIACLLFGFAGILFAHVLFAHGGYEFAAAFVGIILFCISNGVLSVFNPKFLSYTLPSWLLFVLLLIALLLLARFVASQSIQQYPEYIFMLKSIVGFYFIISILARIVRAMWEFAEADM